MVILFNLVSFQKFILNEITDKFLGYFQEALHIILQEKLKTSIYCETVIVNAFPQYFPFKQLFFKPFRILDLFNSSILDKSSMCVIKGIVTRLSVPVYKP